MRYNKIPTIILFMFILVPNLLCEEQRVFYNSQNRRDPFLPLVSTSGYVLDLGVDLEVSDLKVEGIMHEETKESLAIVNGKVVKKGDRIGDFTVEEISKDRVVFLGSDGKTIEVVLKKEE